VRYSFALFLRGVGAVSPGYSVRIIPILGSMSRPCSRPVPRLVRMGLTDEAAVVAAGAKSHPVAATGLARYSLPDLLDLYQLAQ
jgi:hypothetical protein